MRLVFWVSFEVCFHLVLRVKDGRASKFSPFAGCLFEVNECLSAGTQLELP